MAGEWLLKGGLVAIAVAFVLLGIGHGLYWECVRKTALQIPYRQHRRRFRFWWQTQMLQKQSVAERAMDKKTLVRAGRARMTAGIGVWLIAAGMLTILAGNVMGRR